MHIHLKVLKWSNVTLELSEVVALFRRDSLSSRVTGVDISVSTSVALVAAFWNESEIVVGWIPIGKKAEVR